MLRGERAEGAGDVPARRRQRIGLAVLSLAALLNSLDSSVNVAFPAIIAAFGIEVAAIKWIVIAYIIGLASLTIVFGKLGDLFGHKRVFVIGIVASVAAFSLCPLAQSYEMLVAFRVLQGIATGLATSCVLALMTFLFPEEERRGVVGLFVLIVGCGMAIGPIVGGILVDAFGWPAVFWYRALLAVVVLMAVALIPQAPRSAAETPRFDWGGAVLLAAIIGAAVALSLEIGGGRPDAVVVAALLVALALCVRQLARHERQQESPIIDVRHFASRPFSLLQLAAVIINFCCFSILLLVPFVLDRRFAMSFLHSGLAIALFPCGVIASGALLARLPAGIRSEQLAVCGLFLAAAGLLSLGLSLGWAQLPGMAAAMLLTGLGLGLFKIGCVDTSTALLPPSERGVAGSLYGVTQVLGYMLGASLITGLLSAFQAGAAAGDAFAATFLALGAFLLLAAAATGALMGGASAPRTVA